MVEVICLVCGVIINLPQYIDIEKYDGQVTCQKCGSLFHIKLVNSKVQRYKVVDKKFKALNLTDLIIQMQNERNQKEKGK